MGNVKDRYLQHQAAGDQVCGETVAGLDVNSERFSISPPHFIIKDAGDNERDNTSESTTNGCTGDDISMSAARLGFCDLEAQVFNLCSIEWPELVDV
jgi:hypothetical protein